MRGWSGRYSSINGTYEPQGAHLNFPCWLHRTNTNCIFHTAKTRWVISKELGDGSSCFAFIQDDGSGSPAKCVGVWTRCNESGEWVQDASIKCAEAGAASTDPFVRLRFAMEDEMRKVRIADEADREKMWNKLDRNGDNVVELSEVEALVADLVKTGVWPAWLHNETALQRAYAKTLEESSDGDDKVEKAEFHDLLLNIFWFGKIHDLFDTIDTGDDDNVDLSEFTQGIEKLGLRLPQNLLESEFRSIDKDGSGLADFSEFCLYIRSKLQHDVSDGHTATDHKKVAAHEQLRAGCGPTTTSGVMVKKKIFADFDKLEATLQKMVSDPDHKALIKLWRGLDYNGNNRVSLAETDKWAAERYPILNHKPALMRAQQATLKAGGGKDFVEKKDFKTLLVNLFYYNKLFWVFDQAEEGKDLRMDIKEFQFCLTMAGVKLSPAKAQAEFAKVDVNGGGQILFDEFCTYFVAKKCPEGMTAFVADG